MKQRTKQDVNLKSTESNKDQDSDSEGADLILGLNKDEPVKKFKKKTPFDSDIEGLRLSESPIKYVCGKG